MTIAERHAIAALHRAHLRRWRPRLGDLFRTGSNVGDQARARAAACAGLQQEVEAMTAHPQRHYRRHDDYPGDGASYLFVIVAMAMLIGALLS
jgi:hypothetical protein